MPFKPINEDHAILNASFAIGLSQSLPWKVVEALLKGPTDWRRELPAIDFSQVVEVQINPQTGSPVNRLTRGIEFSHKRPDGTASWLLSVVGAEIRVTTTLYTRWRPTWEKAGDILLSAAGMIGHYLEDQSRTIAVQAVVLQVLDVFVQEDSDAPDYSQLLASTPELPASVFSRGRLWHSHTGWFVERPAGNVLNQLNVDVKMGAEDDATGLPIDQLRMGIQHNQLYRPTELFTLSQTEEKTLRDTVMEEMPLMHEANKAIVRSLLTDEMKRRIKVVG